MRSICRSGRLFYCPSPILIYPKNGTGESSPIPFACTCKVLFLLRTAGRTVSCTASPAIAAGTASAAMSAAGVNALFPVCIQLPHNGSYHCYQYQQYYNGSDIGCKPCKHIKFLLWSDFSFFIPLQLPASPLLPSALWTGGTAGRRTGRSLPVQRWFRNQSRRHQAPSLPGR